jgi:hypothetical protein
MRYWSYLVAKLLLAGALFYGLWDILYSTLSDPETFMYQQMDRFGQDLEWTSIILGLWLLGVGVLYLIVWDQRNRCRTCLRRLRMPIAKGSWGSPLLKGLPSIEYICPYGHGTLRVSDASLAGDDEEDWVKHDDMWKELFETSDKAQR